MKRVTIFLVLFSLAALSAMAVPYASLVRVGATTIGTGWGTTISYFVNEAGGTATVNVVQNPTTSTIVATFPGPAAVGSNTVTWNGTANNASGAVVPVGSYRIKVTVAASKPVAWTEIASNSSLSNYVPTANATLLHTLWAGFSPMEWLISRDPNQDSFGYLLTPVCFTTPAHYGVMQFNPDLSPLNGGDGQSSIDLLFPGTPATAPATPNTSLWGIDFDPQDPTQVWLCGQSGSGYLLKGSWNGAALTDATGGDANLANARDLKVRVEGSKKFAYVTLGSGAIRKVEVTSGVANSATDIVNILALATAGQYSKGVNFDANGNLYYSIRYNNSTTGAGAALYRWNAAQVLAATSGSLTEANAAWNITFPTGSTNGEGVAITPDGNVYFAILNEGALTPTANDGSLRGIYLCGNVSTASNVRTLSVTDRVFAYYGTTSMFSAIGHGLGADLAGNLYYTDRSQEQVRAFSPGGNTSVAVLAPLSQNLTVVVLPASARNWEVFE